MKDLIGVVCLLAPLAKLVLGAFGYHGADGALDQIINGCAAAGVAVGGAILAKSDRFVD